jgi:hypothetical protein
VRRLQAIFGADHVDARSPIPPYRARRYSVRIYVRDARQAAHPQTFEQLEIYPLVNDPEASETRPTQALLLGMIDARIWSRCAFSSQSMG